MKRNGLMRRFLGKGLAALLACSVLAGCGAAENSNADAAYFYSSGDANSYKSESAIASYHDDEAYEYADELWAEGDGGYNSGSGTGADLSGTSASKRKLIKNVSMNVETQEYATLMANLEQRVKELGGYVQSLESYNGSKYANTYNYGYGGTRRNANLVVRIPQSRLDEFVGSVSELANVINRQESVEDVTLQYVDVKSHKESLEVEQARLLELLERAESLEDIITLENRLTSVRYQIESMESTLRTYDDQVDYSTVRIRVDEVEVYTPVEEVKETNWERMVNGLVDSLVNVRDGAVNFGIWFVIHLPYLVIWAVVIIVFILIIKRIRRKKPKKPAAQNAETKDQMAAKADNGVQAPSEKKE